MSDCSSTFWDKDIELSSESFQTNATEAVLCGSSRLFFSCEAQIKNKQFLSTTVTLQPLYRINWENEWPLILNSNLLQVQKIDYKTPINKTLKLHINHSLNTEKSLKRQSTSDFTSLESGTIHNAQSQVFTKNIYNLKALNIYLLGICPSLHSCAQFSKSLSKDSDHKESLESNSIIQVSNPSESLFSVSSDLFQSF